LLVQEPILHATERTLTVYALQANAARRKLIFWGLTCLGVTAVCMILVPSLRNFYDPLDAIIPAVAVVLGVVLLALAGRPRPALIQLAKMDLETGVVTSAGEIVRPDHILQALLYDAGLMDDEADLREDPLLAILEAP
jgi:hypothetical protein